MLDSFSKVFGLIWGHSLPGEEGLLETTWTEAQLGGMAPQGRASWAHHCHCHLQTAETRTWEGMCPTALVRPPSAGTTTWEDPQVAVGPHALPPGSSSHPTWEIMMGPQVNDSQMPGASRGGHPSSGQVEPCVHDPVSSDLWSQRGLPCHPLQQRNCLTGWTAVARLFWFRCPRPLGAPTTTCGSASSGSLARMPASRCR